MSEENIFTEEKPQKQRRSKEDILEIIIAIFLGITAFATAWASWVGSLHGGNQSTNYTTSNNLAADGNARYNEASQSLMQDMMLWNQISEASLNFTYAEKAGDTANAEKYDYQLTQLMSDNASVEFLDAVVWAMEQEEYTSPFEKEGFLESYYEDAMSVLAESEEVLEQGKQDNANGDKFGLVTVIYSVVLFMLGIVGTFKRLPNRYIIVAVAILGFVFATVYMFTIPMPTGFSFLGFFGG